MSSGIWSAASGAVGQSAALDVSANNIANATTPGFRSENSVFRQTFADALGQASGTQSQRYAIARTSTPDLRAGQISHTGRGLDVAITDEKGFFAVATERGERYTRAGSFRASFEGHLLTADGLRVLGTNRQPITLPPDAVDIAVGGDGAITVRGEPTGASVGVFTFANLGALEKDGQVLLRAGPEAGRPLPHTTQLETGALELSNANAVTSMTNLVNASRQFEMVARVIEAFSQVERRAATDIMGRR